MLKKVCNFLTTILILILLVLAIILIAPGLLGYRSLAVLSGSMEPKIPVGSLVFAKEAEPSALEVGDVITYRLSGSTLVTHRVIENDTASGQLITKGDANDVADSNPVEYQNVVGKVKMHLPLIGYLSIYIKTPLGIAGACGLIVILIILVYLPEIFAPAKKKDEDSDIKERDGQ